MADWSMKSLVMKITGVRPSSKLQCSDALKSSLKTHPQKSLQDKSKPSKFIFEGFLCVYFFCYYRVTNVWGLTGFNSVEYSSKPHNDDILNLLLLTKLYHVIY